MREYFILMHPQGMGQKWSDIEIMPEWQRIKILEMYEDWVEDQKRQTENSGSETSRPNSPRFTRG